MDQIINKALQKLKLRVEEINVGFSRQGLSPQSLTAFERQIQNSLGEFGRCVEKAALESADIEKTSIEHDDLRHYWKYKGPQEYQCLFGKIEVRRSVYQANGERTLCPLEVNAGILHHHLTPLSAEFVAYSTAFMVPTELAEFCRRWQYLAPSETVIKQVAAEIGEDLEALRDTYDEKIWEDEGPAPAETSVLAVSRDGTCVNIREEGWRQAQVGSVSFYKKGIENEEDKETAQRLRTAYTGQMPEEKGKVFEEKFVREVDHALDIAPEGCQIVCVADGALGIWKSFESHSRLKAAVHINDFYHSAEQLFKASEALFGAGTEKAANWFAKYRSILKKQKNGALQVMRSIRYYRDKNKIKSGHRAGAIREVLRYFRRNRSRMNYAKYKKLGLPIGSGVVEAACKTLVGQRLKRAGMRWSVEGGQNILNLRSFILSQRWDFIWKCHEETLAAIRIPA